MTVETAVEEAAVGAASSFSWPWVLALGASATIAVAGLFYWGYEHAYNKGAADKTQEIQNAQRAIEANAQAKVAAANQAAALAQAQTAAKQTEVDHANAQAKTASDKLSTTNAELVRLSHAYSHSAKSAATLTTNNGASPDWIGLFSECVSSNQRLAQSLGRSTAKLGQVASDAAKWADQINAANGYINSLPLTNTDLKNLH